MRFIDKMRSAWRAVFRTDEVERDLEDELRFAEEELTSRYLSRGLPAADASRAARAPVTGRVFDECFNLSFGELGVVVAEPRLQRARVESRAAASGVQLSEMRLANDEEIARLLRIITGLNHRAEEHNRRP